MRTGNGAHQGKQVRVQVEAHCQVCGERCDCRGSAASLGAKDRNEVVREGGAHTYPLVFVSSLFTSTSFRLHLSYRRTARLWIDFGRNIVRGLSGLGNTY